jgi:WD40 repeat protein
LASAGRDGVVRLWDLETGKKNRSLKGHANWVTSVAWSPDGKRLASTSNDNSIKLWDPENAKEISTLRGHASEVLSVAWSACIALWHDAGVVLDRAFDRQLNSRAVDHENDVRVKVVTWSSREHVM